MKSNLIFLGLLMCGISLNAQNKMSLEDAIRYALERNITVKKSGLNVEQQNQYIEQNKGLKLPTINSSASASSSVFFNNDIRSNNFGIGLNLAEVNYTIYNGGQNNAQIKKAEINKEFAEQNKADIENNIALNIANQYLQILLNKELVTIAKNQLELSKKQLDLVKKQFRAGVIPKANIYDIEAILANDEQILVSRENLVQSTVLQLKNQLQMPVSTSLELEGMNTEDYINALEIKNPKELYVKALENRPEIKARELQIKSSEQDVLIAKSAVKPSVSLGYTLGTNYNRVNGFLNNKVQDQLYDNLSNNFNVSVRAPIFSANRNKTNHQLAKLNKESAELDLENEKYQLEQKIALGYIDAQNAEKSYISTQKTVFAREISLNYAEKRLKANTINNFDFENAKTNLITAQANLAQAKYEFIFKVKLLEFYAGVPLTL